MFFSFSAPLWKTRGTLCRSLLLLILKEINASAIKIDYLDKKLLASVESRHENVLSVEYPLLPTGVIFRISVGQQIAA